MKNAYTYLSLIVGVCLLLFAQRGACSDTEEKMLTTNLIPVVSITSVPTPAAEGDNSNNSCRNFNDYPIFIGISEPPSADAIATINILGSSTATEGADYELLSTTVTFTPGGASSLFLPINVFDDSDIDPNEVIDIQVSVSGSSNAVADATISTISIVDNERPLAAAIEDIIFEEHFKSGLPASWSLIDNTGGGDWELTLTGPSGTPSAINAPLNTPNGKMIFDSDGKGNDTTPENADLITPAIDCSNFSDISLSFNQFFAKNTPSIDSTKILVGDGTTWTEFAIEVNDMLSANSTSTMNPQKVTIDISSVADNQSTVYIKFRYIGNFNYHWQIDDVVVEGFSPVVIEDDTPPSAPMQEYLGPNGTAYFYSPDIPRKLVAKIENMESFDYGCVSVSIERGAVTGPFTMPFRGTANINHIAKKTFTVKPANNKTDGQYRITLYYTQAEVDGYNSTTPLLWGSSSIIKGNGILSAVKPTNPTAADPLTIEPNFSSGPLPFGNDYSISAIFTDGFGASVGFGVGQNRASVLPIALLSLRGNLVDDYVQLDWTTQSETNNKGFEVQRSLNGSEFESLGFVRGSGTVINSRSYDFQDRDLRETKQYYRLKQFDNDGSYRYSKVIVVNTDADAGLDIMGVTPNPFFHSFEVVLNKEIKETVTVQLFDMNGKLVKILYEGEFEGRIFNFENEFNGLAVGVYALNIVGEKFSLAHRIVKTE